MKISRDLVIGRSGDRNKNLTTEARRRGEDCLNGNSSDLPITHDPPINRSSIIRRWIHNVWYLVMAALREIFDESAYDRFLVRTQALRSVESYREFMREREVAAARRPRCC